MNKARAAALDPRNVLACTETTEFSPALSSKFEVEIVTESMRTWDVPVVANWYVLRALVEATLT